MNSRPQKYIKFHATYESQYNYCPSDFLDQVEDNPRFTEEDIEVWKANNLSKVTLREVKLTRVLTRAASAENLASLGNNSQM